MVEEKVHEQTAATGKTGPAAKPQLIIEFSEGNDLHRPTGIGELDRVLGGGIVAGSLTLVGGDPGIGQVDVAAFSCFPIFQTIWECILCIRGRIGGANRPQGKAHRRDG